MKIFYSWQSDDLDRKKKIHKVISRAINRKNQWEIINPTSTKRGTFELSSAILDAIDDADLFIADLCIVERSVDRSYSNMNVMFECGYAYKSKPGNVIILTSDEAPKEHEFDTRNLRMFIVDHDDEESCKKLEILLGTVTDEIQDDLVLEDLPLSITAENSLTKNVVTIRIKNEGSSSFKVIILSATLGTRTNIKVDKDVPPHGECCIDVSQILRKEKRQPLEVIIDQHGSILKVKVVLIVKNCSKNSLFQSYAYIDKVERLLINGQSEL